jgi:branched-chain amino acid transport system substrate-binding protein
MKAFIRLAAVAGFILAATAASAQTVKIGLLAPFSGPFAIWGSQFKQAVEAFQKVHGDSVKGAKIEVIYRDNAGDPTRTRQLAEEMILREKVSFLTGFALTPPLQPEQNRRPPPIWKWSS